MTITEHKQLISQIPEDLKEGEEIEVRDIDSEWIKTTFIRYWKHGAISSFVDRKGSRLVYNFMYARRPASETKPKRLKDEPWLKHDDGFKWRCVNAQGMAFYLTSKPIIENGAWLADISDHGVSSDLEPVYDATDWQNSLERRPE